MRTAVLSVAVALGVLAIAPLAAAESVGLFAQVPDPPGLPEGIATTSNGEVFVGTNPGDFGPQGPEFGQPTEIIRYAADGTLLRRYVLDGESIVSALPAYGTQGTTADGDDQVYVGDKVPPRVVRLDPATGEESVYATIPDIPPCRAGSDPRHCSDTDGDLRPSPDFITFLPDGTMYVADIQQASVFKIPPGGGPAEVAISDRRFEGANGANGMQFLADGRTYVLNLTIDERAPDLGTGAVFRGRIKADGTEDGNPDVIHRYGVGEGVDGLAVAASGNIYEALFTVNQISVLAPDGRELRRFGSGDAAVQQPVPFDNPASLVFVGNRLLITNQSVFSQNPLTTSVLSVDVGEPGLPLFKPSLRTIAATTKATSTGSAAAGAPASTSPAAGRRRPALRVRVSPRAARSAPRRFTTTGTLTLPAGVTRAQGCRGRVAVRVLAGSTTISTRRVSVTAACTLRSTITFAVPRRFGGRRALSFRTRFVGNAALLPDDAAAISVRVR